MDWLGTDTKKGGKKRSREVAEMTIETRTADMDHLMVQAELGTTCVPFDNLDMYQTHKTEACGLPGKCLVRKAIHDVHQMNKCYSHEHI
eukprot:9368777-Heterocapsa_arctica.AAC.1